jgi:peroxiredoxin
MLGYQAGIQKFADAETQVFGISTDNTPSLGEFAKKNNVSFPLISDFANRKTSADYGVLMPERGIANRATFVIDKEGKITYIEEGSTAVNVDGAATACSRLKPH